MRTKKTLNGILFIQHGIMKLSNTLFVLFCFTFALIARAGAERPNIILIARAGAERPNIILIASHEKTNLAAEHPEKVARLKAQMQAKWKTFAPPRVCRFTGLK
ncbi:MAG: hypothetical protein ABR523_08145, partial [Desulfurivibrionaceae bacterium]